MEEKKTTPKPQAKPKPPVKPKANPRPKPKPVIEKVVDLDKMRIVKLRQFAKKHGVKRWQTRTRRGLYTALKKKGF